MTTPTSSINISDIIDMLSPTLKRKWENKIIDIPKKKKKIKTIAKKQKQLNDKKSSYILIEKKIKFFKNFKSYK